MKINILGWLSRQNIGDEAFKDAHRHIFLGHDLEFFAPPCTVPDSDLFVLGGGAVISPYYLKSLPSNTPKYILGASIEYASEMDLLPQHKFKGIMIRNATDVPILQSKVECPVTAMPDLAFLLSPSEHSIKLEPKKKKLGVMVTDYINPALNRPANKFAQRSFNFIQTLAKQLDDFIRQGWDVYLIPFSTGGYGNDLRINLDIMAFMEKQPINIMQTLAPMEAIALLRDMDLNMCMKFHAHVFSIIAGTPFLSIDLTRKVDLLLSENNLTELKAGSFKGDEFNCTIPEVKEIALNGNYQDKFKLIRKDKIKELNNIISIIHRDWLKNA